MEVKGKNSYRPIEVRRDQDKDLKRLQYVFFRIVRKNQTTGHRQLLDQPNAENTLPGNFLYR
jgi:hypothetical protein